MVSRYGSFSIERSSHRNRKLLGQSYDFTLCLRSDNSTTRYNDWSFRFSQSPCRNLHVFQVCFRPKGGAARKPVFKYAIETAFFLQDIAVTAFDSQVNRAWCSGRSGSKRLAQKIRQQVNSI